MKTKILMALLAGATLLAACKGSGSHYEVANTNSSADSAAVQKGDTAADTKLIKTAEMRFKVKSVTKTSEDISDLTARYKGMIIHHQLNSVSERGNDVRLSNDSIMRVTSLNTTADMIVKVPSEKLDGFMNQVAHMGLYVNLRKMDIEDHTLDYLSNKMKLQSRQEIINAQKNGKVIIKHTADVLALKDDMIDQQIDNKRVNDAVKYSVVSLDMYQSNYISKETIANDDPSAYGLPFFNRIGMAMANGWYIFTELLIGISNLWVFILAFIVIWVAVRRYKRRNMIIPQPAA